MNGLNWKPWDLDVVWGVLAMAALLAVVCAFIFGGGETPKNQEPVWIGAVGHGSVDSSNDHWISAVGHGTTDSRINLDVIRQVTADMWLVLDTTALINRIRKQVLDSLNVAPPETVTVVNLIGDCYCAYRSEYEVCQVRGHTFGGGNGWECRWCDGLYYITTEIAVDTIEISPPTK